MTNEPLAHVSEDGRAHLLATHLAGVANLAGRLASGFGGDSAGRVAGLWHDLGKYSGDFQNMIREANGYAAHLEGEGNERDHSTAGALHAIEVLGPRALPVALAIAGHHTGLGDLPAVRTRLRDRGKRLRDAVLAKGPPQKLLGPKRYDVPEWAEATPHAREFFVRMLFSALVDADFLDTEAFYNSGRAAGRGRRPRIAALRQRLTEHLDALEAGSDSSRVNLIRSDVRRACEDRAAAPPGLFTLTVPTGGGKTLASMAFALAHAERHGLERVVVAIPYTSIIEQNAKVYRDVFGGDAVIEHHSSLDPTKETFRNRLACENWDAPIVVTTTVQLFESLFATRTSRCRKIHNLCRAVIVLDEAQSLPGRLLPPILSALAELALNYHASVVVCTATQPAIGRSDQLREGLDGLEEICAPELHLFDRLERVQVVWPDLDRPTSYEDLAEQIASHPSCLAIVHRREDARRLCEFVDARVSDESTVHLSALMTPTHRLRALADIYARQERSEPVRVVSTQLVEAGVDLDFPIVFRAFGGLDAMAQAAGRCNREGRIERGRLDVFVAPTKPPQGMLRTAFDTSRGMLRSNPDLDLFSPATQLEYFRRLYSASHLDRGHEIQEDRSRMLFRSVAKSFRLIDDSWSAPLVVVHEPEARQRVDTLRRDGISRRTLRALQPYIVNVPRRKLDEWIRDGFVTVFDETVVLLEGPMVRAYDVRFGLVSERVGDIDAEALIL